MGALRYLFSKPSDFQRGVGSGNRVINDREGLRLALAFDYCFGGNIKWSFVHLRCLAFIHMKEMFDTSWDFVLTMCCQDKR